MSEVNAESDYVVDLAPCDVTPSSLKVFSFLAISELSNDFLLLICLWKDDLLSNDVAL